MKGIESGRKVERQHLKYRGSECLNCHHPLDISDKYCPSCSQLNSTKRLTFNDFFNEFFAGIFAYDSRFYRTVRALLFNPGKISKDYIEGKRVRYANPYRFYLSASIIFFVLWGLSTSYDTVRTNATPAQTAAVEEARAETDSLLRVQNIDAPQAGFTLLTDDSLEEVYVPQNELNSLGFWSATGKKMQIFIKHYQETEIINPEEALDSLDYDHSSFDHWLYKKAVDLEVFSSNPNLFLTYFLSKLPFIIFFYLPIFALFIWLFYVRRPFTYMEHLVFTFHNQTTLFVLLALALLLNYFLQSDLVMSLAAFVFLFYLYKAMRRFYGQGRVKTIVKFIIINIIFFILAVFAVIFSVLASFAIY